MIIKHIKGYISIHDAGKIVDSPRGEMFRFLIMCGKLKADHIGGKYVIPLEEFEAFIRDRLQSTNGSKKKINLPKSITRDILAGKPVDWSVYLNDIVIDNKGNNK